MNKNFLRLKWILLFAFFLAGQLFLSPSVHAEWTIVDPVRFPCIGSEWGIFSVRFNWAVGQNSGNGTGVLLHFLNGSWLSATLPEVSTDWALTGVDLTGSNQGWAVGSDFENGRGVLIYFRNPEIPELATVITAGVSNITDTTATGGGNVTSDGGTEVTARGVCWNESGNPVVDGEDTCTTDGTGIGAFTSSLSDLSPGTQYHVRAYATNSAGTAYGNDVTFTTTGTTTTLPTVTTTSVSNIGPTTATGGGNVTSDAGVAVTARGICWSTSANPVLTGTCTNDGTGTGPFTSSIIGLTPNTLYHVRAYATNSNGTGFGNDLTFTTTATVTQPTVNTFPVTSITPNTATGGGIVISDGGAAVLARGVCWSTSANPVEGGTCSSDGTGIGTFVSSITGLTPGTLYHVRAYASNSIGTGYGNDLTFTTTTTMTLPTVTTAPISDITATSATAGGNVTADGGAAVTLKGVCWSTSGNPILGGRCTNNGTGTGPFTSSITELTPDTLYHVRAFAVNSNGTNYGEDLTFRTTTSPVPILITTGISKITATTATGGGFVTYPGNTPVTERGVCWDTSQDPAIGGNCTHDGAGTGAFTSSITGLTSCTLYHVRAYATNNDGTGYGKDVTFTTGSTTAANLIWPAASIDPPKVSSNWGLSAVHFVSSHNGWAVGQDIENGRGVILLFSDRSWRLIDTPSVVTPPELSLGWGLSAVHSNWAVGQYEYKPDPEHQPNLINSRGVILHYSGGSWTSIMPPDVSSDWGLSGVRSLRSGGAWMVGSDFENGTGVLLHFVDGSWDPDVIIPDVSLNWGLSSVDFVSSNEGWAVGEDFENKRGVLLHFKDGSWTSETPPDVSSDWGLSGIDMGSPASGWAVGQDFEIGRGVLLNYSVPKISVSPKSLDYGQVQIGAFLEKTVTVKSTGNGNLIIDTVTAPSPDFYINNDNCSGRSLARGKTCKITYRFQPESADVLPTQSDILSNASNENPASLTLTGAGKMEEPANYIQLLSPSNDETFTGCDYFNPPPFQWDSSGIFASIEIQFSPNDDFSTVPLQVKGDPSVNSLTLKPNVWKKILLLPKENGGTVYWRVVANKKDKTIVESDVFSFNVDPPGPVVNPDLSHTSKTTTPPPELSWDNNCNMSFNVWFGNDSNFKNPSMKKLRIPFAVNPDQIQELFTKELTPTQWNAIRKLGGDITGATLYLYVESWDPLGRLQSTEVMSFVLTD